MGILFEEVSDPIERRKKLIENGQLMCQQIKQAAAQHDPIDHNVINVANALNSTLKAIGEISA